MKKKRKRKILCQKKKRGKIGRKNEDEGEDEDEDEDEEEFILTKKKKQIGKHKYALVKKSRKERTQISCCHSLLPQFYNQGFPQTCTSSQFYPHLQSIFQHPSSRLCTCGLGSVMGVHCNKHFSNCGH